MSATPTSTNSACSSAPQHFRNKKRVRLDLIERVFGASGIAAFVTAALLPVSLGCFITTLCILSLAASSIAIVLLCARVCCGFPANQNGRVRSVNPTTANHKTSKE